MLGLYLSSQIKEDVITQILSTSKLKDINAFIVSEYNFSPFYELAKQYGIKAVPRISPEYSDGVILDYLQRRGSCCLLIDTTYVNKLEDIKKLVASLQNHPGELYIMILADTEKQGLSQIVQELDPITTAFIPIVGSDEVMKAMYEQFPKVRAAIYPMFDIDVVTPMYAQNYRNMFLMSDKDDPYTSDSFKNFYLYYRKEIISMVSYPSNPKTGMIVNPLSVSQFQPGHSEFECGAFCVAILGRSTAPSIQNNFSVNNLIGFAEQEYTKLTGTDGPTNIMGLNYGGMHNILKDSNLHYWDLDKPDKVNIQAAIMHGYPVIVSVPERFVFDLDIGGNPYWWGAKGSHYVIIAGNHPDGNFLVIDPAAVAMGDRNLQSPKTPLSWPRHYRLDVIDWGCIIQMPWLPTIPSNISTDWSPYQPDIKQPVQAVTMIYDPNEKQIMFVVNNQVIRRDTLV